MKDGRYRASILALPTALASDACPVGLPERSAVAKAGSEVSYSIVLYLVWLRMIGEIIIPLREFPPFGNSNLAQLPHALTGVVGQAIPTVDDINPA